MHAECETKTISKTIIVVSFFLAVFLSLTIVVSADCQKNLDDNQADAYRACLEAGYGLECTE